METKDLWKELDRGDPLSIVELDACINEIEAAMPYLRSRGPILALVWKDAHTRLYELKRIRAARTAAQEGRTPT